MKKRLIFLLFCLCLLTSSIVLANELIWLKITLIERPYVNPRTGEILLSIENRKNKPNIDPFKGGGKIYPDLSEVKIIETHEKDFYYLVLVEGTQDAINKILNDQAFEISMCSNNEAEDLKKNLFDVIPLESIKSGTTK